MVASIAVVSRILSLMDSFWVGSFGISWMYLFVVRIV